MKYFEIPACRTLLIADWFDELGSLGFKDHVNMVKLNKRKLKEQVEYWFTHDKEREEIAKAGEILIQQRHSVDIRARELIEHLEGLDKECHVE
jgi:spore maturation protein CgeB